MCSAPQPKAPTINPYQGFGSNDPRFQNAVRELGIKSLNSQNDIDAVNKYLIKKDFELAGRDPNFAVAEQQLFDEGLLKDKDSRDQTYLASVQGRMFDITQDQQYADQKAETEKLQKDFQDQLAEQNKASQAAMEEMMEESRKIYNPRRGDLAPVMAPVVQPKPIPVAPQAPQMQIQKTPPAPELTSSPASMAIIRQPKSARQRRRNRSRGTASLST